MSDNPDVLDDILFGGQAIARYIRQPEHVTYRWIAAKVIPAGKAPGTNMLMASKPRIREKLDRIASGDAK
jgi:hypothetical protein